MYTHFISLRHGSYDDDNDRLSDIGKSQMQQIARDIKDIVGEDATYTIVCSSAPRAVDSAETLIEALETTCSINSFDHLWAATDAPKGKGHHDQPDRIRLLKEAINQYEESATVIIFITHYGLAQRIFTLVTRKSHDSNMGTGEGLLFDKRAGTTTKLP